MRKKVIAANWKMYKTPEQAREFFRDFLPLIEGHDRDEIVVCPNYLALDAAIQSAKGSIVAIVIFLFTRGVPQRRSFLSSRGIRLQRFRDPWRQVLEIDEMLGEVLNTDTIGHCC